MKNQVKLRPLTRQEAEEIRRLVETRRGPARMVQRARLIAAMIEDPALPATRAGIRVGYKRLGVGPQWVKRFNRFGLAALLDRPRPGRLPAHENKVREFVLTIVQKSPQEAGYGFKVWTLPRIQEIVKHEYRVSLSISTIWEWMQTAGFRWDRKKGWGRE